MQYSWCPPKKKGKTHRGAHTERARSYDDKGRGWSDTVVSQGRPRILGTTRIKEEPREVK
jgi:hypothetical protein